MKSLLPLVFYFVATSTALASTAPFPPAHEKICNSLPDSVSSSTKNEQFIDRAKFADYILTKYPLSIRALPKSAHPDQSDVGTFIMGHIEEICIKKDECSAADNLAAEAIRGALFQFFLSSNQKASYLKPPGLSPASYFLPTSATRPEIQCIYDGGLPVNPPGAILDEPEKITTPFRLRGKVEDLYIDRSEDAFKTSSQSSISITSDATAGKATASVQGVIGYLIPTNFLTEQGQYSNIIPYLQVNYSRVKATNGSAVKPNKTETYSLGVLSNFYFRTGEPLRPIGHTINIRPDFLVNNVDRSSILSLNMQYVPIVNQYINSFKDGFTPALYKWIVDARLDGGTFTDRGKSTVSKMNRDYLRFGGQIGLALATRSDQLPLTFTSTYTAMSAIKGKQDVGYFSNSAS